MRSKYWVKEDHHGTTNGMPRMLGAGRAVLAVPLQAMWRPVLPRLLSAAPRPHYQRRLRDAALAAHANSETRGPEDSSLKLLKRGNVHLEYRGPPLRAVAGSSLRVGEARGRHSRLSRPEARPLGRWPYADRYICPAITC